MAVSIGKRLGMRLLAGGMTPAVLLAVIVFFSGLIGLGDNADRLAIQREEAQANNALEGSIKEVANETTVNTQWDDAVVNISNHYNKTWVTQHIGFYYTQPGRYDFVYVIDSADKPVFGMRATKPLALGAFSELRGPAAPLIASVRSQEQKRGPIKRGVVIDKILSKPITASEVARVDNRLYILTASLVQPEFSLNSVEVAPRSAIVFTAKPIDATFLGALSQRLMINNVRLAPAGPTPRADAFINLMDRNGNQLAKIVWTPHRPGGDLISIALLPILLGVGAPLVLFFMGRRTARRLALTLKDLAHARDEADAANAQKTIFLATMSHEIRTPLNGVMAMAQVMDMNELPADQRGRLAVILHSSETLLTIVNDILDLSKIEAGRLDLDPRPFDVGEILGALEELYEPVARDKGVGFSVVAEPDVQGAWIGDPDRIRQVVANLISNALKFTPRGEVRVRVRALAASGLRIEVTDTGIGIAADKIDLVFEKFRQAQSSTTRRFGGTGLGLSICRQLVTLMGGRIWLESREGEGSTFFVEIPLERSADAVATSGLAERAPDEVRLPLHILGVDDNPTNRMVLEAILEPMGFKVDLRDDGAAALEAWRSTAYDLILMDVQMPVLDGVAATVGIRAEEAASGRRRTPIIALTANAMTHQLAEYRDAGMDDCVAKPIRIPDLLAAIDRVTAGEASIEATEAA